MSTFEIPEQCIACPVQIWFTEMYESNQQMYDKTLSQMSAYQEHAEILDDVFAEAEASSDEGITAQEMSQNHRDAFIEVLDGAMAAMRKIEHDSVAMAEQCSTPLTATSVRKPVIFTHTFCTSALAHITQSRNGISASFVTRREM